MNDQNKRCHRCKMIGHIRRNCCEAARRMTDIDREVAYNNTSEGQQRNETNIILGDYTVSLRFIETDNISSTIVRITRFERLIFYRNFMNEKKQ